MDEKIYEEQEPETEVEQLWEEAEPEPTPKTNPRPADRTTTHVGKPVIIPASRISFGGEEPPEHTYRKLNSGFYGCWVYKNAEEVDGEWYADGAYIETLLPENEAVVACEKLLEPKEPETTVEDLVEAINLLTDLVLGGG